MSFRDELFQRRDEIIAIAKKYGGSNLRVFGSVARGDDQPESDLDLLVEPAPECDLFDRIGLIQDLESLLHKKIDVESDKAVHPLMKYRISLEAVTL